MQRRPGFPMWTLEQWMERWTLSQTRRAAGAVTAFSRMMQMYQISTSSIQVCYDIPLGHPSPRLMQDAFGASSYTVLSGPQELSNLQMMRQPLSEYRTWMILTFELAHICLAVC